jgi:hypothetical protein
LSVSQADDPVRAPACTYHQSAEVKICTQWQEEVVCFLCQICEVSGLETIQKRTKPNLTTGQREQ